MNEFNIRFAEQQLDDLRRRLDMARLPQAWRGAGWSYGTDSDYLSKLLAYWRDEYDWRRRERELNRYPQFTCELDGVTIHFFHIRSSRENAPALLLTHGWPDSFLRYAKLFPLLPDYDLVVPSLPGFAFSTLPAKGFSNNAETAELWHELMTDVLGYKQYVASGGDMGRGVTGYLAANHPEVLGGLPTPRSPSEKRGDRVVNAAGEDVTEQFRRGAEEALRICRENACTMAILKSKSPSCGCGVIHNGQFNGGLTEGNGVLAQMLLDAGIPVVTEKEF